MLFDIYNIIYYISVWAVATASATYINAIYIHPSSISTLHTYNSNEIEMMVKKFNERLLFEIHTQ